MEWLDVRRRLLEAVAAIKARKVVDIGIKSLLGAIPVVGGFAAESWDRLDGKGEQDALALAAALQRLADNQALYEQVARQVEKDGDVLLELSGSLTQVVQDLESVREDTSFSRRLLETWDEALRAEPARRGVALSFAMMNDRQRAATVLDGVRDLIADSGVPPSTSTYYLLGLLYAERYQYEQAEACLLHVTDDLDLGAVAHRGLAATYQRWANEQIGKENFGIAGDLLDKAERHAKEAGHDDLLDLQTLNQLGYTYKDMAIRYQAPRSGRAEEYFARAQQFFTSVLQQEPHDASAHNGVAGVALMTGDLDLAIREADAALAEQPDYREAAFDLAQALSAKFRSSHGDDIWLVRGLQTYLELLEREAADPRLPAHALARLRRLYEPLTAAGPTPAPNQQTGGVPAPGDAGPGDPPPRLLHALQAYRAYLQQLGVDVGVIPEIRIESTPSAVHVAFPDPARNRLVIGAAFAAYPDSVLHEYSHLVLERGSGTSRASWSGALGALEAGLAYYLPCSHRDSPRLSFVDLTDRSTTPESIDRAHAIGYRWAGAFWQIRARVGRARSDTALLGAWRQTLPPGEGSGTRFTDHLSALLEEAGAPDAARVVREALSGWQLPPVER